MWSALALEHINASAIGTTFAVICNELAIRTFLHRSGRSIRRPIQLAADRKHGVADFFRREADRRLPPEQLVTWIGNELRRVFGRRLTVGSGHHDLLVQPLYTPSVLNKIRRQPIEQFRMRW